MSTELSPGQPNNQEPKAENQPLIEFYPSRQFMPWLYEHQLSFGFSTYQTGKLFMIGAQSDGRPWIHQRTFNRAMGLALQGRSLLLSTLFQLWHFEDALPENQTHQGCDKLYVPQLAWTTGDLDIHDIAVTRDNSIVFCNTLFSCLASPSQQSSFKPIWQPSFISKLAPEDRCHLNGLALRDGEPGFVTAVARSDVSDGWRDRRSDGGIVIDVPSNEIIAHGLSMPHSPRWHDPGNGAKLWLLDSGTGRFGYIEQDDGRFVQLAFCPGYARGMSMFGRFALIGLSLARDNKTFTGLPLDERLAAQNVDARCGLLVVDMISGDTLHWARITGKITELYDVLWLPQTRQPMALGLVSDEIRRMITIDDADQPA